MNAKSLQRIEILAQLMDGQFEIFGFRFGLNFIIGLVPELGDSITTIIALYIFGVAVRQGVSKWVVARMLGNIAMYFVVGLVPWLGDAFGAWWKPNRRNVQLLRSALQTKGQ